MEATGRARSIRTRASHSSLTARNDVRFWESDRCARWPAIACWLAQPHHTEAFYWHPGALSVQHQPSPLQANPTFSFGTCALAFALGLSFPNQGPPKRVKPHLSPMHVHTKCLGLRTSGLVPPPPSQVPFPCSLPSPPPLHSIFRHLDRHPAYLAYPKARRAEAKGGWTV